MEPVGRAHPTKEIIVSEFDREQPSQEPEVALLRLRLTVPTLLQRLDERLLASHVRDVVAMGQAYLERRIQWPALLVGLEAALFQARACMADDATAEALVTAAEAVARYAGAAMGRMAGAGAEGPEAPVIGVAKAPAATPSNPDVHNPDSQAGPASGTGFALSVSNSKANPKVQTNNPKPKPYPKPKTEGSTS
jgi:hypothetical protein